MDILKKSVDKLGHYYRMAGFRGMVMAIQGQVMGSSRVLESYRAELSNPFYVRVPSSDLDVVKQIFVDLEYGFDVRFAPGTIIDAGANIGLASIYFANRFPDAKIFAIEPEESNFLLLKQNIAPYPNIVPIHAALWHEPAKINIVDPKSGKWGFMTETVTTSGELVGSVDTVTIEQILEVHEIDKVDILKIDIEGAEREVFGCSSRWINRVDGVIAELHERLKAGCNENFRNSTHGFDDQWTIGENHYCARRTGCLIAPVTN